MSSADHSSVMLHRYVYLLPLTAVLVWAVNIVVTRYAVDLISPISISFYRWLIALVVLTPFCLPKVIRRWVDVRTHLLRLAVLGFFGMVCYQGLAYTAAHYTTATNMGIINAFIPIFSILLSLVVLQIRTSAMALLGSVISIVGLGYLVTQGNIQLLLHGQHIIGDLLMILAVMLYAGYGVLLQHWKITLPLSIMLYMQICFAVVLHLPFLLYFGLDALNASNLPPVLYAALFPSIVAPLVWMMSIQALGSNKSSVFLNLAPIFTAIIAYIFLKEQWTTYHTIGGIMVLVGILLVQKK